MLQIALISIFDCSKQGSCKGFLSFQMVLSREHALQMVVVILEKYTSPSALMVAYIVLTAAVTMPFKISHMPRKISLIPSRPLSSLR